MISRTAVPPSMRPSDGVCIVGSRRLVEGWVNSNLAYVGHFYIGDDMVQARDRLGIATLKNLFNAVVIPIPKNFATLTEFFRVEPVLGRHEREQVEAHHWRGLAVLGSLQDRCAPLR